MYELLKTVLTLSAVGSVTALIIFALRPITKRLFGWGWQYYIWLTALLIMVMPVSFRIPREAGAENEIGSRIIKIYAGYGEKAANVMSEGSEKTDIVEVMALIYVAGVLITGAFRLARYFIFKRGLYKSSVPCDLGEPLPKGLAVRKTKAADAPLLIGLLKPVLLLPDTNYQVNELKYALKHELVHYRRKDILYKWFVMLVKTLHWFDPVVYWISARINEDCEISCDMAVTKGMDDREKKEYMRAVLNIAAASPKKEIALTTGLSGSGKMIKKRFSYVVKGRYAGRTCAVFSVFFAALLFSAGALASGTANGKFVPQKNAVSIVDPPAETEHKDIEIPKNSYVPEQLYEPEAEAVDGDEQTPPSPAEEVPEYPAEVTEPDYVETPLAEKEKVVDGEYTTELTEKVSDPITGSYSYRENGKACVRGVKSDENGNISIFFRSDTPGHTIYVEVRESETEKLVEGFIGVVNNENIYDISDLDTLDPEKEYDIYLDTRTGQDWLIEGEYFIY